jgi:hypothetical protein
LVLEARQVAAVMNRSIAGQIEHWAFIGKAVEPCLSGEKIFALKHSKPEPLSKSLSIVGTPAGRKRLDDYLKTQPYPHYEPSDRPGILVRIEADGTRSVGRFENRVWKTVRSAAGKPSRGR